MKKKKSWASAGGKKYPNLFSEPILVLILKWLLVQDF